MTPIRVDPEELNRAALAIEEAAQKMRELGEEALEVGLSAPSYDGQFGPKVQTLGLEAQASIQAQANRLRELSQSLEETAANFAQADAASQAGLVGLFATFKDWLAQMGLVPQQLEDTQAIDRIRAILTATPRPTPRPTPSPTPTATPTPLPTASGSSSVPAYWGGLSEAQLAAYQQFQGQRNDCAEFSIAAALNIMYAGAVKGEDVAEAADQIPWLLPWAGLRMWPNGPTSPQQQANIVNGIADQGGFDFRATAQKTTPEELIDSLSDPDTAVIVTIGWGKDNPPQLSISSVRGTAAGADQPFNGHAMLFAAYDPTHLDADGNVAAWGFVNSWVDGSNPNSPQEIYWMPDDDFREGFSYNLPLMGANNVVVINEDAPIGTAGSGSSVRTPGTSASPVPTPTPTPSPHPTAEPTPPRLQILRPSLLLRSIRLPTEFVV